MGQVSFSRCGYSAKYSYGLPGHYSVLGARGHRGGRARAPRRDSALPLTKAGPRVRRHSAPRPGRNFASRLVSRP